MISAFKLNVTGINTHRVTERLKILRMIHHLSIIAIMEQFSYSVFVQNYKVHLDMENATSNCNGKLRVYWNSDIDCTILDKDEQQVTCDMKQNEL